MGGFTTTGGAGADGALSAADAAGLPERLRAETAKAHLQVEAVTDVERTVVTREGYVGLLGRLHGLHAGLEDRLTARTWDQRWAGVDIDIADHCRAGLLVADLAELGAPVTAPLVQPPLRGFAHAMGALYVLEGSALGGRIVAGLVRSAIGEVPTAFLTGRGRGHRAPWPAVRRSLRLFDAQGGDGDEVVAAALDTFAVFGRHLARPASRR